MPHPGAAASEVPGSLEANLPAERRPPETKSEEVEIEEELQKRLPIERSHGEHPEHLRSRCVIFREQSITNGKCHQNE